jgi:DNA polymerase
MGVHPLSKKWTRLTLFSGLLLENICQGTSSDILNHSLLTLSKRTDLVPVLHVHDEIVCETTGGYLKDLEDIMTTALPWTEGLPLAVGGFEADRYRK